jgi:predicted unusual protein kinase regulating ubiquinone biosynthesis (AarF/ABC1/UbiB family)
MIYGAVNREVDVIIDAMADLGAVGQDTDRRALHRAIQSMLDKYYGLPVKRFDVGVLLDEFSDILRRHDVTMPRDTIMLIKAFSTIAGVINRLDPELDLLEMIRPRLRQTMRERFSPRSLTHEVLRASWHLANIFRTAPGQLRRSLRKLGTKTSTGSSTRSIGRATGFRLPWSSRRSSWAAPSWSAQTPTSKSWASSFSTSESSATSSPGSWGWDWPGPSSAAAGCTRRRFDTFRNF